MRSTACCSTSAGIWGWTTGPCSTVRCCAASCSSPLLSAGGRALARWQRPLAHLLCGDPDLGPFALALDAGHCPARGEPHRHLHEPVAGHDGSPCHQLARGAAHQLSPHRWRHDPDGVLLAQLLVRPVTVRRAPGLRWRAVRKSRIKRPPSRRSLVRCPASLRRQIEILGIDRSCGFW